MTTGLRASLLIVLLVACGNDDTPAANTYPVRGGLDDEDFSAGVSIRCAPIGAKVDISTANDDLSAAGGAIADGRWELTRSFIPNDEPGAVTVVGKKASVLAFAGHEVAWSSDTDLYGDPLAECCRGTWSVEEDEVTLHVRCTGGNEEYVFEYTADSTKITLRTSGNQYVDTFDKR